MRLGLGFGVGVGVEFLGRELGSTGLCNLSLARFQDGNRGQVSGQDSRLGSGCRIKIGVEL